MKIYNAKKSIEDDRDFIYEDFIKFNYNQLPIVVDYRNELQPIRNQGDQGSCYAQSAACMKEWQELKDIGVKEYMSPQFFYNHRNYWNDDKKDGDDPNEDNGMNGRDVMKILQTVGICFEKEYGYGRIEKASEIPKEIIDSAKNHIIKNYAKVKTMDGLKNSLIENGPCLITFPVYNNSNKMWIKNKDDKKIGGHAMAVVGFNKKSFIIRNSWGANWGDKGYCYYDFNEWGNHWECWTTIDRESKNIKPKPNIYSCCTIV